MSYILDALKRSDRERQQGKAPGVNTIHDRPTRGSNRRSGRSELHLVLLIAALILFLAVSSVAWFWPKGTATPNTNSVAGKGLEKKVTAEKTPKKTTISSSLAQAAPPAPLEMEQKTTTILLPEKSVDIPKLQDLPPLLKTAIPDLQLAGHTYSDDPAKRMIIINSNILREGERMDNNTRLVEITWTGVILDYKGQLFSIDIE